MKKNNTGIKLMYMIALCAIILHSFSGFSKPADLTQASASSFFTEKDFNRFFPKPNKFYSYSAFVKAIDQLKPIQVTIEKRGDWIYKITRKDKKTGVTKIVRQDPDWDQPWAKTKPFTSYQIDYADFCNGKDLPSVKKELAAFFAHAAHETRGGRDGLYNDGLLFIKEADTLNPYTSENKIYPAVQGKKYYGRGPLQLSYNGNYGFASDCLFGDKNILLKNPDLITQDAVLAFKTAIYFWMTPQSLKPSAHSVMRGLWKPTLTDSNLGRVPGFGMTINIINGALECNKGNNQAMNDRIGFYKHFLKLLGLTDNGPACSCSSMASY